jgi:polyhydroxyalkanoate synthesis regulator phasin
MTNWFVVTLDTNDPKRMLTSDGGVMIASHEKMAARIANELNMRTAKIHGLEAKVKELEQQINDLEFMNGLMIP